MLKEYGLVIQNRLFRVAVDAVGGSVARYNNITHRVAQQCDIIYNITDDTVAKNRWSDNTFCKTLHCLFTSQPLVLLSQVESDLGISATPVQEKNNNA